MKLKPHQRAALIDWNADHIADRLVDMAREIAYEGITLKALKEWTDEELLFDYEYYYGYSEGADYSNDILYSEIVAERELESIVNEC